MTHEESQVHEYIDGFKEFGMNNDQAMFATLTVLQAKYSEALINAPMGHRVDFWDRALDYLGTLIAFQETGMVDWRETQG